MSAAPNPLPPRPAVMGPYRPNWIERPSADDLSRYYPDRAARQGVSGEVMMTCQVRVDGRLNDCRIQSEVPKGQHFGEAALRLSPKFRMIPPDDLKTAPGEVTVPLVFQIPKGEKRTPPTPREFRDAAQVGLGVAVVATALLVGLVVLLGRYHNRKARGSAAKP